MSHTCFAIMESAERWHVGISQTFSLFHKICCHSFSQGTWWNRIRRFREKFLAQPVSLRSVSCVKQITWPGTESGLSVLTQTMFVYCGTGMKNETDHTIRQIWDSDFHRIFSYFDSGKNIEIFMIGHCYKTGFIDLLRPSVNVGPRPSLWVKCTNRWFSQLWHF